MVTNGYLLPNFDQLASSPSSTVHMGSQAGKAYRLVLEEHGTCYSVLALLLAFVTPSRKRKGDESPSEKLRRLSSPRHWDVALAPSPEDFAPLPTTTETGLACSAPWAFPPSLSVLEPRANKFRVLAIAEAGDTVTADHLLQMASLAAEHKPTVLGIPGQVPIPYQLECTVVLLQSLHALFQLLTFFPRVRTPCGHGAQVIVEGREEQSDGGEKNKDNQTNQNKETTAHRPSHHHLVVFPLC